jgi:hypothetical protein
MKILKIFFIFILLPLSLFSFASYDALTTATQMATQIQGSGIIISNPVISRGSSGSSDGQVATFSNGIAGANLQIDTGILLTSSYVSSAFSKNIIGNTSKKPKEVGPTGMDPDLLTTANFDIHDQVVFEFDVTLDLDTTILDVDYQFASEEYPEYVGSKFNDAFGFFISGGDLSATYNIARVIDASTTPSLATLNNHPPINVNTVNNGFLGESAALDNPNVDLTNSAFFIDNGGLNPRGVDQSKAYIISEFDGFTKKLHATLSELTPGITYHFKMALADTSDRKYDAGVFISKINGLVERRVSIDDVNQTEGNSGTTNFNFTIKLNRASTETTSINYTTLNTGTATSGTDYTAKSGTVTFAAGETSKTVTIKVNGDTLIENNEIFYVKLSNPVNLKIGDDTGKGTILNDDTPNISISINDVSKTEGNSGIKNFSFTVTLNEASNQAITLDYSTADGTANANEDYTSKTGSLTFAAGETSKTISIEVNGDTKVEADETFTVTLSNPSNASITDAQGIGTILNDDYSNVSINDIEKYEGNAGDITPFAFEVNLDQVDREDITIEYRIDDGTASKNDDDYNATVSTGSITISAGQLSNSIPVDVIGDDKVERDETFHVILTGITVNHIISDGNGTGTILNDDNATITISDVNLTEGDFGLKAFDFNVTMSNPHYEEVRFNYYVIADTADKGSDYVDKNGTITFEAGTVEQNISINVIGDLYIEADETFNVYLEPVTFNTTLAKDTGIGTIINDDSIYSDKITFNIERTNSNDINNINSKKRHALYTQVTGRTFAYDVLAYTKVSPEAENFEAEITLDKVVVKVNLYNEANETINTQYHYFNNTHRKSGSTFKLYDADKESSYNIISLRTTGPNGGRYLIRSICPLNNNNQAIDAKKCYHDTIDEYQNLNLPLETNSTDARDNFAIRPAALYYGIADANATSPYIENSINIPQSTRLIAGRTYTLAAQGLSYQSSSEFVTKYTGDINATLEYSILSGNGCPIQTNTSYTIEGNNTTNLKYSEVGIYTLGLIDDTWTNIDNNTLGDCISGSSDISDDYNEQSGCDISSESSKNNVQNQTFGYVPARFDLSNIARNIRLAGAGVAGLNTVYMNTLNGALTPMSIEIAGNIIARAEDNNLTSNYTQGCMAQNIDFAFTLSAFDTDDANTPVNFDNLRTENNVNNQLLQYNFINTNPAIVVPVGGGNETNITSNVSTNTQNLLSGVRASTFNNARSNITLNVNINRNRNQAMNPKRIVFNRIDVNSTIDSNNIHNLNIVGQKLALGGTTLLYARVRASQKNYDANTPNFARNTPIQIEIFCDDPILGGSCIDAAGNPKYGLRIDETSSGWWLSTLQQTLNNATNINLIVDKNMFNLNDENNTNANNITVAVPATNITPNNNANNANNANNSNVNTVCPNAIPDFTNVNAATSSPYVLYGNDPLYTLDCRGASNWSGVGDESNVINGAGAAGAINTNTNSRLSW